MVTKTESDLLQLGNPPCTKRFTSGGNCSSQAEAFQAALAKTSFYKDAKAKFGGEAWALLQKYAGNMG